MARRIVKRKKSVRKKNKKQRGGNRFGTKIDEITNGALRIVAEVMKKAVEERNKRRSLNNV
jgi:hypothetical protein